jgi:hypothetical protein
MSTQSAKAQPQLKMEALYQYVCKIRRICMYLIGLDWETDSTIDI